MGTNEILEQLVKGSITTDIGGNFEYDQYQQFIRLTKEKSQLLKRVNVLTGIRSSQRCLDDIIFSEDALQKATQGVAPSDLISPTIKSRTMYLEEIIYPLDVTLNFIEENIEGNNVEDTILDGVTKAFANGITKQAIAGDTSNSTQPNLLDGWLKKMGGNVLVNKVTLATGELTDVKAEFSKMLKAMPIEWKTDPGLAFIVSPDVYQTYQDQLGGRATALGDSVITGTAPIRYNGIEVIPVPYMPSGANKKIILTPLSNLVVGFGRDISRDKQYNGRKRAFEYTIHTKIGVEYVLSQAVVLGV